MARQKFIRWIVLANFIILMGLFLVYRAGYFDDYIYNKGSMQTSPNGGAIADNTTDTVPKTKDSLQKTRLPSSKVFTPAIEPASPNQSGWTKKRRDTLILDSAGMQRIRMMSSSKSGAIFESDKPAIKRRMPLNRADTFDRTKREPAVNVDSSGKELFPGSKSAMVFNPDHPAFKKDTKKKNTTKKGNTKKDTATSKNKEQ